MTNSFANLENKIKSIDIITYMEAKEAFQSHNPTSDEFPLLSVLVDKEDKVHNIIEAALLVINRFRNAIHTEAFKRYKTTLSVD